MAQAFTSAPASTYSDVDSAVLGSYVVDQISTGPQE